MFKMVLGAAMQNMEASSRGLVFMLCLSWEKTLWPAVASTAAILWGDEPTSVPKDTESRGGEEWGGIPLSREGVSPSGPPPANYVSGEHLYILQWY